MNIKTKEEKIEYQIAKLHNQKSEFIDSRMFDLCYDYINEIVTDNTYTHSSKVNLCRDSIMLCEKFKNICISELSWSIICQLAKNSDVSLNKVNEFIIFLCQKNFMKNNISKELLDYMKSPLYSSNLDSLYSANISRLFVFDTSNNYVDFVVINANEFVRELLTEFILESPRVRGIATAKVFYELFEDSFDDINYANSISSIEHFTCNTFEQQFSYFSKLDNKFPIRVLINLYLFLTGKYTNLFKISDIL